MPPRAFAWPASTRISFVPRVHRRAEVRCRAFAGQGDLHGLERQREHAGAAGDHRDGRGSPGDHDGAAHTLPGVSRDSRPPKRIGRDPLPRDPHRLDQAIRVEMQLVDADDAMVAIGVAERPAMVDDVPLARRRRRAAQSGGRRRSRRSDPAGGSSPRARKARTATSRSHRRPRNSVRSIRLRTT